MIMTGGKELYYKLKDVGQSEWGKVNGFAMGPFASRELGEIRPAAGSSPTVAGGPTVPPARA